MAPSRRSRAEARPKILCLGMSYACVESQMDAEGYNRAILDETLPSVKQAIELVRRNVLTEMDARDLARCRAMEEKHKVDAFTVSQECGARYDRRRHLQANFNRANFGRALEKAFGQADQPPTFRQVILDYFWIPSGSWMTMHWSKSFFHTTLPNFVKLGLLEYPPPNAARTESLGYGNVYLPFCLHCVREIIASISELRVYYKISFLYKWQLNEHALWSGTATISPTDMQDWLGKNIAQEDIYCTFAPRDVFEAMEDTHITKADVVKVLRGIEDFADVRMIRLEPLQRHNPRHKRLRNGSTAVQDEVGGFVGLLNPKLVERGFDSLLPTKADTETTEDMSSEEEREELPLSKPMSAKKIVRKTKQIWKQEKKQRMYRFVPNMDIYNSLGTEGEDELTERYELSTKERFRLPCDIETYYFYPEQDEILESEDSNDRYAEDSESFVDGDDTAKDDLMSAVGEEGTGSSRSTGHLAKEQSTSIADAHMLKIPPSNHAHNSIHLEQTIDSDDSDLTPEVVTPSPERIQSPLPMRADGTQPDKATDTQASPFSSVLKGCVLQTAYLPKPRIRVSLSPQIALFSTFSVDVQVPRLKMSAGELINELLQEPSLDMLLPAICGQLSGLNGIPLPRSNFGLLLGDGYVCHVKIDGRNNNDHALISVSLRLRRGRMEPPCTDIMDAIYNNACVNRMEVEIHATHVADDQSLPYLRQHANLTTSQVTLSTHGLCWISKYTMTNNVLATRALLERVES